MIHAGRVYLCRSGPHPRSQRVAEQRRLCAGSLKNTEAPLNTASPRSASIGLVDRPSWRIVAGVIPGIAAAVVLLERWWPAVAAATEVRLSVHVSIIATLFLVASAVIYVAYLLAGSVAVGRLASTATGFGASALIGASLARWVEVHWLSSGDLRYAEEYEALTWIAACTSYAYLCVEAVYKTRVAGALILGCVVGVLGAAGWLIGAAPVPDTAFMPLAHVYVRAAVVCAASAGTGLLGIVSVLSVMALVSASPAGHWLRAMGRLHHHVALAALCLLTIAVVLDVAGRILFPLGAGSFGSRWLHVAWYCCGFAFVAGRTYRCGRAAPACWWVACLGAMFLSTMFFPSWP